MTKSNRILNLLMVCIALSVLSCNDDDEETNLPPEIADQTFSIAKNSPNGTVVGTVLATDREQDALTYSITEGNSNDAFAIGETSGQITVQDASAVLAEASTSFALTVTVDDGKNNATATITITLEDVTPAIGDQGFSIDENSENGTTVDTVTATNPGQTPSDFSITAGNSGDAFAINTSTGEITVKTASALDFEVTPSFSLTVEVSNGAGSASATVTITLNDIKEPFITRQQIIDNLADSYTKLKSYTEFSYLFDAVYANKINAPDTDWDQIYAHSQTPENAQVERLWSDAYEIIFILNNIISSAETVLPEGQEKDEITAQAQAIRAYLYFHLVVWFNNIPVETGIMTANTPFNSAEQVLLQTETDLNTAIAVLPSEWTGDNAGNFTKGTARMILARVYAYSEKWAEAKGVLQEIMSSGLYTLNTETNSFAAGDPEIIWGFDQTGDQTFAAIYNRGDHVPLVRLTETHLLCAEANIYLGTLIPAQDILDNLKARAGEAPIIGTPGPDELLEFTFSQAESEMGLGGVSFVTLKRFGRAVTELSITEFKLVLPIPQVVIDNNLNALQNPSY